MKKHIDKRVAALCAPIALVVTMLFVFQAMNRTFGFPLGYLLAFCVYWFGWCLLGAAVLRSGQETLRGLFQPMPAPGGLSWQTHVLLWTPLAFPAVFIFLPRLGRTNWRVLLASLLLGAMTGVAEEIFWRGVFFRLFPKRFSLRVLYPSAMFGLWHLCPLSVTPNRSPGGPAAFVIYAAALGIMYAVVTQRTGSVAWAAFAHVAHDTLGLGGAMYALWLQ